MVESLDAATDDGARAFRRLQSELIAWLTTINPDGQPQASPIWFVWDGDEILLYSMTRAPRNGNIADRPLIAFNLEAGTDGEDVVTAEGEARILPDEPPASANPAFLAKYKGMFDSYGWTPEWYADRYSVAIRIRPTRWRLG
jgi:PPOX class probable F420-dependent enzyme